MKCANCDKIIPNDKTNCHTCQMMLDIRRDLGVETYDKRQDKEEYLDKHKKYLLNI